MSTAVDFDVKTHSVTCRYV